MNSKNINSLILALICMIVFSLYIPAVQEVYGDGEHPPRIVDEAGLLQNEKREELKRKLNEISKKRRCDVVIVTIDSLQGDNVTKKADDLYDYGGYGLGEEDDGVMLMISMENRDWAISTHSFGIEAFTDAGQEYIMERVKPHLSEGDYNEAFSTFAGLCDKFIAKARKGSPYDEGNLPKNPIPVFHIIGSLIAGTVLSFMIMMYRRKDLRPVRRNSVAGNYIISNSLKVTGSGERFLYNTVSMIKIKKDGGGGSSTHTGTSGRTHGGSAGKF